jgi:hypothetical protein
MYPEIQPMSDNISWMKDEYKLHDTDRDQPKRGGGGPPSGGNNVEPRVAKLESHMEYVRSDISSIKVDVKGVAGDIVALKLSSQAVENRLANIENHMVTKGRLTFLALLGLATVVASALGAAWWMAQQYLGPILKNITQ